MRILDTDTCVALLRGQKQVLRRRETTTDDVATTWVTAGELFFGAARSTAPTDNARIVTQFLATLDVFPPDLVSSRLFGEMKAQLFSTGRPAADADLLIASIAIAHGAIVVTGNHNHFARIDGLRIEDWIRG